MVGAGPSIDRVAGCPGAGAPWCGKPPPPGRPAVCIVLFRVPVTLPALPPATLDPQSLARQFSLETQTRAIDACDDIEALRRIARTLLISWHHQADMTRRFGAQALGLPYSS